MRQRIRRFFIHAFAGFLLVLSGSPAFAGSNALTEFTLNQRVYVASRVYASLANFAHMQDVPDVDVEAAYRSYLDKAIANENRRDFTLASMEFLAGFHNGHTIFIDRELLQQDSALPFIAKWIGGQWVIAESWSPDLKPGEVIEKIDGQSFEQFFQDRRRYISASSESGTRNGLFSRIFTFALYAHLFPERFVLTLAGDRKVTVDRRELRSTPFAPTEGRWLEPGKSAYIRIPSFFDPKYEKRALELVREFQHASLLIVDVRGNSGGSTPSELTTLLMDRPSRWWIESTPVTMPYFRYRASLGEWQYQAFNRPQLVWPSPVQSPPKDGFTGRLAILVDGGCNSSCEDFTMPFKDNHRALIVGETTSGSTGQPYVLELEKGLMILVGAKRAMFPDGTRFEGVGIKPDIEVHPTAEDLAQGRDVALEAARKYQAK